MASPLLCFFVPFGVANYSKVFARFIYNIGMGLFNKLPNEKELGQFSQIAMATVQGYILRQIAEQDPDKALSDNKPVSLLHIIVGQLIGYLFGFEVDASNAQATDRVIKEFDKTVEPMLPRMANEAVFRDEDLGRLSLNTLEQRVSQLEKLHGASWVETDEGARVKSVLQTVFGHQYTKPISYTKYKYIVITTNEKYKKEASNVDWASILDPTNYA